MGMAMGTRALLWAAFMHYVIYVQCEYWIFDGDELDQDTNTRAWQYAFTTSGWAGKRKPFIEYSITPTITSPDSVDGAPLENLEVMAFEYKYYEMIGGPSKVLGRACDGRKQTIAIVPGTPLVLWDPRDIYNDTVMKGIVEIRQSGIINPQTKRFV